jgi:hypothetical protein
MFGALFFGDFLLGKTKRKLPRAWAAQAHGLQRQASQPKAALNQKKRRLTP